MNDNTKLTYTIEVSKFTFMHKDLVFAQALRQLIEVFQPYLDEGQIDTLLEREARRPRPQGVLSHE